jgi:hypothetical protein
MTEDASLEQLGKEIMARLKAAEKAAEKASDHSLAAGLRLIEARDKTGDTFKDFLRKFCPTLKRSRALQLIAIAGGKTTVAAERTKTAERVRKHRAAKAAAPAPTDSPLRSPLRNGQPGETAQVRKNSPEWLLGEVSFFINARFSQMDAATLAKAKAMVAAWEPERVQEAA